ncbi:MAG: decaprenyl-phosphate phosphoribosyltransferase [Myxococcaceae bacterium]
MTLAAILRTVRPRQWTKNLAVFAPLLFSRSVFRPGAALDAALAVASFCLLAAGTYALNDWVDRDKDRRHPEKRLRPIATGELSGFVVFAVWCLGWAGGLGVAFAVRPQFGQVALAYLALQVLYTFALKRFVLVDVMVIALGFVIRVAGGGVAIDVPVSNWLFLCTLLLAVFLGFAKRRAELSALAGDAGAHRESLEQYSLPLLDQLIAVTAASCVLSYGLYAVSAETIEKVGSDRMKFTVPFVLYGFFRYLFLIHRQGAGGAPERVLLTDAPILFTLLGFVGAAGWALYS